MDKRIWEGQPLEVIIHRRPCLLYEATELIFSYVNQLPAEQLSGKGEFCVPVEEAAQIRETVCQGLDLNDRMLQFYFQGFQLEGSMDRLSNLATTMLYSCSIDLDADPGRMQEYLLRMWHEMDQPYSIEAADPFALSMTSGNPAEIISFSDEVSKLPFPPVYQLRLVDAFSQYDRYLDRLVNILRPVMERLEPLLEPWIQRAQPLVQQWERYFSEPENVHEFFRGRVNGFDCQRVEVMLRYFPGSGGYYRVKGPTDQACLLPGLEMRPGPKTERPPQMLDEGEAAALRLISNTDRLAMLRSMMKSSKSGHELAQELGLNSGTVFRDLSNLATARLINRDFRNGKNVYCTNFEMLRRLTTRILQVVGPDEKI